jgi:hypothetical protein
LIKHDFNEFGDGVRVGQTDKDELTASGGGDAMPDAAQGSEDEKRKIGLGLGLPVKHLVNSGREKDRQTESNQSISCSCAPPPSSLAQPTVHGSPIIPILCFVKYNYGYIQTKPKGTAGNICSSRSCWRLARRRSPKPVDHLRPKPAQLEKEK